MTGLLARRTGRLAFLGGVVAPALLALSLTPTLAGGPYFSQGRAPGSGSGSLGGFGGEGCSLGQIGTPDFPCQQFANNLSQVVGAVGLPLGGKLSSFDIATVDPNLGLFFLANRGTVNTLNNGIEVLNTRTTDHLFQMYNQPLYQRSLCQGRFRGVGDFSHGQNGINQTYNMGPNGIVVVNSRAVWAGDGDSTIKVCSLGGVLLKTITTTSDVTGKKGAARVGRGCFDSEHQTVLFVNDMERNFDTAWRLVPDAQKQNFPTAYPFFNIYDARTYAKKPGATHTLNSDYLGDAPDYIKKYYTGVTKVTTAASNGVGSCIYNTHTHSFWLVIPECYNQTAQKAYLTDFQFFASAAAAAAGTPVYTHVYTGNGGAGGDPNAGHGCVAEINPTTGALIAVFDVGAPAFTNPSAGPNPGQASGDCTFSINGDGLSAIQDVCGATFKDVCVAPMGIVQGPSPQVLLGCGATVQTIAGGESTGIQATYKATSPNCKGTKYPAANTFPQAYTDTTATSATFGQLVTTGKMGSGTLVQWPCMNPDFPTAVLDDGGPCPDPVTYPNSCPLGHGVKGQLYAVLTQMAGAEQVAFDPLSFSGSSVHAADNEVVLPPGEEDLATHGHYLLASSSFHAMTAAASMCTITSALVSGTGTPTFSATTAGINCLTTPQSGESFQCNNASPQVCSTYSYLISPPIQTAALAGIGSLPSGFTTTSYNCGNDQGLPGETFGTEVGQTPGPGVLNSVDATALAAYITHVGQQVDATPNPGPNKSPINNPALINHYAPTPINGTPIYHLNACSNPGSIIGQYGASHAVAVDIHTNQVYVAVPNDAMTGRQGGAQVIGSFGGWQPGGSEESMFPIDPQYAPSARGHDAPGGGFGGTCDVTKPCVGQQAIPTQNNSFTSLCNRGTDQIGVVGSDANGCILVLQDGP